MLKPRLSSRDGPEKRNPSLFDAARMNDLGEMKEALEAGKRLDEVDWEDGFTPLHVAAYNGSHAFIRMAIGHHSANPWRRDHQGYLAIDHADARGDREIAKLFYGVMYPNGDVPLAD